MSYNPSGSLFPAGFQRVTDEPTQLMYDPFDGTLDTTNTWTATNGNSSVLASNTAGLMSMGTGTTANGWSKLTSKGSFKPTVPSWMGVSFLNILPDLAAPIANSFRFFGVGTTPATPTTATPITDGVGFEITTAGKMFAVVYSAGTRIPIQDLSAATGNSKQPTDANGHRYIIYVRTDRIFFYIDGLSDSNLVATSSFQYPSVQILPVLMLAVGGPTPPASNTQVQSVGSTVWDTGKNNHTISDASYPWRRATVGAHGGLNIVGVQSANSTASWTSATGVNAALTVDVTNLNTVSIAAVSTSTFTGGVIIFEVSMDNTNWIPIMAARIDTMGVEASYTVVASTIRGWSTSVDGFTYFRIRLSTAITGSGTLTVGLAAQTMPVEPIVNAAIIPNTVGGLTPYHLVSAATTNATVVKASAGHLYGWYIYNSNTTARKVAFHNSASAPTAGASIFFTLIIPPTSGANVLHDIGIAFTNGIAITTVTDLTDAGTTAVALNDLNINLFYK